VGSRVGHRVASLSASQEALGYILGWALVAPFLWALSASLARGPPGWHRSIGPILFLILGECARSGERCGPERLCAGRFFYSRQTIWTHSPCWRHFPQLDTDKPLIYAIEGPPDQPVKPKVFGA